MADVVPHRTRPVPPTGVLALYRTRDWWPERTAEQIAAVLGTGPAVGAWDGEALVGFGRAVTDGVLRAYLEDVVVAPGYQGTGLGRRLVDALVAELGPVPVVSLFCAADLVPFYESAGFHVTRQVVLHRAGLTPPRRPGRGPAGTPGRGRRRTGTAGPAPRRSARDE